MNDLVYISGDILLRSIDKVDAKLKSLPRSYHSLEVVSQFFENHYMDVVGVLGESLWLPAIGSVQWVVDQQDKDLDSAYFAWAQFMKAVVGCHEGTKWVVRFVGGRPVAVPTREAPMCLEVRYNSRQECEMAIALLDPQVESIGDEFSEFTC